MSQLIDSLKTTHTGKLTAVEPTRLSATLTTSTPADSFPPSRPKLKNPEKTIAN